jgi:hypothetical protein
MVLDNVPEAQALDDVFWMAVYNLVLAGHANDTDRFYDILLPFLTGKSVEESLVEADTADASTGSVGEVGAYGDWRSPQRSNTSYVRCLLEAIYFMLRTKNVDKVDCKVVGVAIRTQFVEFIQRDLKHLRPDENGAKVIEMSCSQLSYAAAKLAASWDEHADEPRPEDSVTDVKLKQDGDEFDDAMNEFLGSSKGASSDSKDASTESTGTEQQRQCIDRILKLVTKVSNQVEGILQDSVVPPPMLDLTGPNNGEQKLGRTDATAEEITDPAMVQSYDMLAWDVEQVAPDPGQAVPTPPYMAVDLTQVPRRVATRDEAVDALRTCDRLCTLLENQTHCIKNRKFLIGERAFPILYTHAPPLRYTVYSVIVFSTMYQYDVSYREGRVCIMGNAGCSDLYSTRHDDRDPNPQTPCGWTRRTHPYSC